MEFELQIIAVQENFIDDKQNPGKKIRLNKITCLMSEGVVEMWTPKDYTVGEMLPCKVVPGPKYKPVVKVV